MQVEEINATEARNNFFILLKRSFLNKQKYLIRKGDIPMVYIVPVNYEDLKKAMPKKEKQMNILRQAAKLRKSMPKSSDSIKLIQEMRMHGK
jgi:hypothetical protein